MPRTPAGTDRPRLASLQLQPLEPRRLMTITSSLVEVPISGAAIAVDPSLASCHTFDLRVNVAPGDSWLSARLHLTLRRGHMYQPDPADHLPEPGYWPSHPNLAYASVLADADWFAPPEDPANVFGETRVEAAWFAIDGHETSDRPRTFTIARLTLSADASGVVLSQLMGQRSGRPLSSPIVMSDVYRGQVYRTNNGYISGTVFDDRNGDGDRDQPDEGPLAGRTVYLDADHDGVLDADERRTSTDADGFYEFYGLATGTYKVREVVPAHFRQTTPHHNFGWSIPVWAGHVAQYKNFGSCAATMNNAAVSGAFFDDRNGNGVRDGDENPAWELRAYLDNNGDGKLSAGEPMSPPGSDVFQFEGLPSGRYVVRYVARPGDLPTTTDLYTVTLAAGAHIAGILFGVRRAT